MRPGSTVAGPVPPEAVPAEIAEWLAGENLPARLAASPDPALDRYPWSSRPLLTLERRRAEAEDRVALTPCFAGVAETGTLAMLSRARTPGHAQLPAGGAYCARPHARPCGRL